MGGARRDRAGPPPGLDPHLPAVRVRHGRRLRVAEDVVHQRHECAEPLDRTLEHMFVRVARGPDGTRWGRQAVPPTPASPQEPSDDQTSSLVRTRSTTADVNSVVPAWPPRSGVLIPEAIVSRVPS